MDNPLRFAELQFDSFEPLLYSVLDFFDDHISSGRAGGHGASDVQTGKT